MKAFVEQVMKALVDKPDALSVSDLCGKHSVIIEVRCHADDMGRVIGKNGKTIGAVRTLLSGLAAKRGCRAMLEVVE